LILPLSLYSNIKGPSELKLAIQISLSSTVSELKDKIASSTEIEKERQRLIYSGELRWLKRG
jgi:ubiquilin